MPASDHSDYRVTISWALGFEKPARKFAQQHKLPIIDELPDWRGLCFCLRDSGWVLEDHSGEIQNPFVLEFESRYLAQGKDPLLKAMGKAQSVLDLTAGWGGDALHIAHSGRVVTSVERNPVVFQLLDQARNRLGDTALSGRLKFVHLDAAKDNFIQQLDQYPGAVARYDLVYIDPMFSDKSLKRARTKKPMRLMQRLLEAPCASNESALFENALVIAQKRVVVKRGLKAPYLTERKPQGSIRSKLLRFDLYQA